MTTYIEDFTENNYRELLRIAKSTWKFRPLVEFREPGRTCLWRHDMDISPQRARRLAQIEAEEGVVSSYHVEPHSHFYNALEEETRDIVHEIASLGHEVGLHFDWRFYSPEEYARRGLVDIVAFEKELIERAAGVKLSSFSYHNVDGLPPAITTEEDEIAGMVNVKSRYLTGRYGYCSDSNGYWRFRRLRDVLEGGQDESLMVLTHPEWWVPEPMAPRDRIARCVEGRAKRTMQHYDDGLVAFGRTNVR